jgi:hypothetical protein
MISIVKFKAQRGAIRPKEHITETRRPQTHCLQSASRSSLSTPKMILSVITDSFPKSMADCLQIAVNEALPRNEVKQTPYGVLCTTSLGGHLSWFELGGGRWFPRAVSMPDPLRRLWSHLYSGKTTAFLQKMAREMDLEKMPNSDDAFEGGIVSSKREPLKLAFEPMRRKLHLPTSA